MKKISADAGKILLMEVCTIPVYIIMFVLLAFNDSDYQANSLIVLLPYPLFIIVLQAVICWVIMRSYQQINKVIIAIYVVMKVIISCFWFGMYMSVYADEQINSRYNLLYHIEQLKIDSLRENQGKAYEIYQKNKNDYVTIHKFEADGGWFSLLLEPKQKQLYWLFHNKEGEMFFYEMERVETPTPEHSVTFEKKIKETDYGEFIWEETFLERKRLNNTYIKWGNDGEVYYHKLNSSKWIVIGDEKLPIEWYIRKNIKDNFQSYEITLENGVVQRKGIIGEKSIGWLIKRDGIQILHRNAENETELHLDLFPEKGRYTIYVTEYIDGEYRQVSNELEWEVK